MKVTTVILAAGQGTRMHSSTPKVLHMLAGQPLIRYSLQAAAGIGTEIPVVVIGHASEQVRQVVGDEARFVLQEPQLGTGHAVRMAESLLGGKTDLVLVISADMPLMSGDTLRRMVSIQQAGPGPITMLTLLAEDSHGFGRVIRALDGSICEIVEEAQASAEQLAIRELNVGAYCFKASWLWDALKRIPLSPKGEYYLTDTVGLAVADGLPVQAFALEENGEALGINTRIHLAEAESILRERINSKHMLAGVTLMDPNSTYIQADVTIGQDTVVWPNTYLRGKTSIGEGCTIGPNTIIEDTQIGNACTVLASVLEGAVVEDHVGMGPFCHLRKGAHLAQDVHMGNFGEVKDSYLGPGTKMGHFSYIGNAHIAEDVNIGAGTITCNFDGVNKNPTEIGAHAFIGSDTMLVAPITIGEGARTGAGSVVTHDVPPQDVVVGVPARHLNKTEKSE